MREFINVTSVCRGPLYHGPRLREDFSMNCARCGACEWEATPDKLYAYRCAYCHSPKKSAEVTAIEADALGFAACR